MVRVKQFILIFCSFIAFYCCEAQSESKTHINQKSNTMDLSKILNETVRQAVEALQANDKEAFYSHFTADAKFSDDGNEKDFKAFFDNAFNHKEKFLSLDKIENGGKNLEGDFFAGQWGTFKVFFNFTLNSDDKIERVDIGQVSKR